MAHVSQLRATLSVLKTGSTFRKIAMLPVSAPESSISSMGQVVAHLFKHPDMVSLTVIFRNHLEHGSLSFVCLAFSSWLFYQAPNAAGEIPFAEWTSKDVCPFLVVCHRRFVETLFYRLLFLFTIFVLSFLFLCLFLFLFFVPDRAQTFQSFQLFVGRNSPDVVLLRLSSEQLKEQFGVTDDFVLNAVSMLKGILSFDCCFCLFTSST